MVAILLLSGLLPTIGGPQLLTEICNTHEGWVGQEEVLSKGFWRGGGRKAEGGREGGGGGGGGREGEGGSEGGRGGGES